MKYELHLTNERRKRIETELSRYYGEYSGWHKLVHVAIARELRRAEQDKYAMPIPEAKNLENNIAYTM